MNRICYIIGAGTVDVGSYRATDDDLIICADGGYRYSNILGRECDLVVGDFDSFGSIPDVKNKFVAPREKDETDMALAVEKGFERGYDTFVIFGALGGDRYDHSIANIQLLHKIAHLNGIGFLVEGDRIFTAVKNNSLIFNKNCRGYLSVFSLTDMSRLVTLKNLKYELSNHTLYSRMPLAVSNEFIGESAVVSVGDGVLLLYWHGSVKDVL